MKRYFSTVLFLLIVVVFSVGCTDDSTTSNLQGLLEEPQIVAPPQRPPVDPSQPSERTESGGSTGLVLPIQPLNPDGTTGPVDIDLTRMSVTMVSATVMQIIMHPEDFLGQTIRIRGSHFSFFWEEGDMQLNYVVLDLTAGCCGEALEFILPDYIVDSVGIPPQYAVIEIVGTLSSYEIFGYTFHYLAVSELIIE